MTSLREMVEGDRLVRAPLVLNPLMAKMAERAGFDKRFEPILNVAEIRWR